MALALSNMALNVLGLMLFVVFIACIISLAAAMTWAVVRVTPTKKDSPES
jgi:uncharacterized BrkB/YihY/UPF0761 family membrane protein